MSRFSPQSAAHRTSFGLIAIITLILPAPFVHVVFGQGYPAPPAPTTYPHDNGNLIAVEGLVHQPSTQPDNDHLGWTRGEDAAVAIDDPAEGLSRFLVAWETDITEVLTVDPISLIYIGVLANRFDANGECLTWGEIPPNDVCGPVGLSTHVGQPGDNCYNFTPSLTMSSDATARAAFVGHQSALLFSSRHGPSVSDSLLRLEPFSFDDDPSTWPTELAPWQSTKETFPSIGMVEESPYRDLVVWNRHYCCGYTAWIKHDPAQSNETLETNSSSYTESLRMYQFNSCLASRPDGVHAIVWTQIESGFEAIDVPPMDILMQIFDEDGTSLGNTIVVNNPLVEREDSLQRSPAVSFVGDQIVVVWFGPGLDNCSATSRIFARRFQWNSGNTTPVALGEPFIVDSDPDAAPLETYVDSLDVLANPTVSLERNGSGRWVVAWTSVPTVGWPPPGSEIRGQYFQFSKPHGGEFRINQNNNPDGFDTAPGTEGCQCNTLQRRLGASGQHSIAYGSLGVVCAWTAFDEPITIGQSSNYNNNQVYFTLLPPGFDDYQDEIGPNCCKGDMNGNGYVQGNDIAPFIAMLLDPPAGDPCDSIVENYALICAADANNDGLVSLYDVDGFVDLLYGGGGCDLVGFHLGTPRYDCDGNDIEDAEDIAEGRLHDCNANGYPDECEFELALMTATDCNENGIPDECDVKSETSPDCNQNGIPDECDIASQHSPDIDEDGIPDECALMEFYGPSGGGIDCAEEPEDLEAAWAEFYLWAAQQTWGPASGLSGAEQYQLIVDKKCELGLPLTAPH